MPCSRKVDQPIAKHRKYFHLYLQIDQSSSDPRGGGVHSLIWAIQGCAAGQGMVIWPRCPKQSIQFDLPLPYTGSEPVLNGITSRETLTQNASMACLS